MTVHRAGDAEAGASLEDLPRVSDLTGRKVVSDQGRLLGTVDDVLIDENDGRIVGYLVCSRYVDDWHVMNVAVDPSLLRQGIATTLLDRLFAQADGPGEQYTLEVRPSNAPAIGLYERFGFYTAGKRRGYYHDNREDALIMWRRCGAGSGAETSEPRTGAAGG